MNRKVLPFFLMLLAWFALGFFLCKKFLCNATPSESISQSSLAPVPAETNIWNITDGNNFQTSSNEYFGFAKSASAHMGLSSGLESAITSAANYLKSNPERSLDITGYYMDDETNNSILPTLGLARANDVKSLFVNAGVPSNQLNLKDALLPNVKWANATALTRGIELGFSARNTADDRLEDIKSRLLGKPLTLYFGTNQDKISFSSQQRSDIADMIYYLDRVSDSNINISGHTDSSGRRSANMRLSQERAEFVLAYLAKNGLSSNRMSSQGFGPDQPIASNDSSEGMAKNRRVEVILN